MYNSYSDSGSDFTVSSDESPDIGEIPSQAIGPTKKWDAFQVHPPDVDSGSAAAMVWVKRFEKLMLILAYILGFLIIFTAAVVGKGVTFFMISQVSPYENRTLPYCNDDLLLPDDTKDYEVRREKPDGYAAQVELDQVAWIWCLIFSYTVPEVLAFLRSLRVIVMKSWARPTFFEFAFVFLTEISGAVGFSLLVFMALPQLDSTHGLALTNCLCIVPGILRALSRRSDENNRWILTAIDVLAIVFQLSGIFIWPILKWTDSDSTVSEMEHEWVIPLACVMISASWWECFVDEESPVPFIQWMYALRSKMINRTRYYTYLWMSALKILAFFLTSWLIVSTNDVLSDPTNLFSLFKESFGIHQYSVSEVKDTILGDPYDSENVYELRYEALLDTDDNVPLNVLLIQMFCCYGAYIFGKWACKVQIQSFSFSIPLSSVVPTCITLLLAGCGARGADVCAFNPAVPDYLFFECPAVGDYLEYMKQEGSWLWAFWFFSQLWITLHIWFPKSTRLASTEQLFGTPMYSGLAIDQSLVLNRRADGEHMINFQDLMQDVQDEKMDSYYTKYVDEYESSSKPRSGFNNSKSSKTVRASDKVTKIYGCATMWHENKEEMIEMLKSIFRIDMDYSARRLAQKYLQVFDPDYYEWETHIFFDDAFELGENDEDEQIVNTFVKLLVRVMDEAGSFVHCRNIRVRAPKRYPTPYGGRLVWTLPGKTKIVCHLKDKAKIRHKKRWSQCMYMYYLLGFRLMELPISDERKEVIAENTYLLALDGDIDFQPEAITRLVDLMKKNKNLGAACGRIHPTGSGFMQWYQMFEYAIGHWLQKATEHVMGCVLCSPGCFSLFRAKGLMDDNVMKMYTTKSENPRDFVQYDQGEDRWLCTLLLQRGWRVEYSAASDAFTACPEGFGEFFNQRRRWMPSTIANIFDVLSDYKQVTKVNDDISILYIAYQIMLMVGTVLGPGSIFMMLSGAFAISFNITDWDALLINLIPIVFFMIACYFFPTNLQIFIAQILSAIYALLMMAVLIGIGLQVQEDGPLAPTSLSLFLVFGSFFLAAVLHPQEFWCLPYVIVYYITIPAMYLLLVIYSIFNLHVVSWGTREVPKKQTKAELEEEKKKEEELKKAAKKKKKDGGLLDFLYKQSGTTEKGGMEFSLANLFKCMLFTHEDQEDPKKQLIKIAASMEEVTHRLGKIENNVGMSSGGGLSSFRRRSSYGRRQTRGSSLAAPLNEVVDDLETARSSIVINQQPEYFSSDSSSEEEQKAQRDDLVNPYWIEDRDLKNGPIDFLPGVEVQFWKDLIEKYLEPLVKDAKKEKEQARGLKTLRNQMVFSIAMLNAVFVIVVYLLQDNKETIYITWPWDADCNVTYAGPENNPVVEIFYDYLHLEPVGFMFVIFFAIILIIQLTGMFFHRWGTISQIISTTRLPMCEKQAKEITDEGDLSKHALAITQELMRETKKETEEEKFARGKAGRRQTVANLTRAQTMQKRREQQTEDLEKRFRDRFQSIKFEDMETSDIPALRRLSTRRGTRNLLEKRRASFWEGERRRSTLISERRQSQADAAIPDSVGDSDFQDDYSGGGGSYSLGSQHLETVDDDSSSDGNRHGNPEDISTDRTSF